MAAAAATAWGAAWVAVHGLLNATDLNGRHGTVVSWQEGRGRYAVRLDGATHGTKAIRPANLRDAAAGEEQGVEHGRCHSSSPYDSEPVPECPQASLEVATAGATGAAEDATTSRGAAGPRGALLAFNCCRAAPESESDDII